MQILNTMTLINSVEQCTLTSLLYFYANFLLTVGVMRISDLITVYILLMYVLFHLSCVCVVNSAVCDISDWCLCPVCQLLLIYYCFVICIFFKSVDILSVSSDCIKYHCCFHWSSVLKLLQVRVGIQRIAAGGFYIDFPVSQPAAWNH